MSLAMKVGANHAKHTTTRWNSTREVVFHTKGIDGIVHVRDDVADIYPCVDSAWSGCHALFFAHVLEWKRSSECNLFQASFVLSVEWRMTIHCDVLNGVASTPRRLALVRSTRSTTRLPRLLVPISRGAPTLPSRIHRVVQKAPSSRASVPSVAMADLCTTCIRG